MSELLSSRPADVILEVTRHNINLEGFLHTDFGHQRCACSGERVSRVPINSALPDGGVCHDCGGMMVRTGTCTTCTGCGATGGCG